MQLRATDTQLAQRDTQVSQLQTDLAGLTKSQSHLESELESAYGDIYTLQELVKEMNSELHGAKFVINDCVRGGAGTFTQEYLKRSQDYDSKVVS